MERWHGSSWWRPAAPAVTFNLDLGPRRAVLVRDAMALGELALLNARAYGRARRLIAAGIARGVAEGAFRRLDPAEAGAVILALLDGLSLQLRFEDGDDARGDRSDRARRRRGRRPLARAARLAEEALVRYLTPTREEAPHAR